MEYVDKRLEAANRLGREGTMRLLEDEKGYRFVGNRSGINVSFHLSDDDESPSGSFCPDKLLINNFVDGKGYTIESVLGNGDKSAGARLFMQRGGWAIKSTRQARKALEEVDFDSLLIETPIAHDLISGSHVFFDRLCADCVAYLLSAPDSMPIIQYLTETRGISRQTAANRHIGIVPQGRLAQLVADLIGIGYPTGPLEAFVRGGGYANFMIWLPRLHGEVTAIKVRGLPKPQSKNPKNTWICTIRPGEQGHLGNITKGPGYAFEGEFNLLQADEQVGSPINGLAVGSASAGKKLAEHLHTLSDDLTVIGDSDAPGRAMVQAIANIKPIKVVYPPNEEDADEYLRHSSWESLLALSKTLMPSWDGYRERLRPMLMQQTGEAQKDRITSLMFEAFYQKGRILRTTHGECLYVEE